MWRLLVVCVNLVCGFQIRTDYGGRLYSDRAVAQATKVTGCITNRHANLSKILCARHGCRRYGKNPHHAKEKKTNRGSGCKPVHLRDKMDFLCLLKVAKNIPFRDVINDLGYMHDEQVDESEHD